MKICWQTRSVSAEKTWSLVELWRVTRSTFTALSESHFVGNLYKQISAYECRIWKQGTRFRCRKHSGFRPSVVQAVLTNHVWRVFGCMQVNSVESNRSEKASAKMCPLNTIGCHLKTVKLFISFLKLIFIHMQTSVHALSHLKLIIGPRSLLATIEAQNIGCFPKGWIVIRW